MTITTEMELTDQELTTTEVEMATTGYAGGLDLVHNML